ANDGLVNDAGAPQTPAWHVSPPVQVLPSSQAVPSGAGGLEQTPVTGSRVPATWHGSSGVQGGSVSVQVPARQAAGPPPALHTVPSGAAGFAQVPVDGSQVPARWQESEATQVFSVPA